MTAPPGMWDTPRAARALEEALTAWRALCRAKGWLYDYSAHVELVHELPWVL